VYRFYDEDMDCVFYDIDCGCAMRKKRQNGKLACIRLEDEKIFYVS
jgi:serine/threonine protein phosphatase 1